MTPDYNVQADGQDVTAAIRDRLLRLEVRDGVGVEQDETTIEIDDRDGAVEMPPTGAALDVAIGWAGGSLAPMGRFVVHERGRRSPPRSLFIRSLSADVHSGFHAPRDADWHDTTVGALVSAVAGRNGLTAHVADGLGGLALAHVDQSAESDMALVRRLGRDVDAVARVAGGRLVFAPFAALGGAAVELRVRDAASYEFSAADRDRWGSVTALWRDTDTSTPRRVVVGDGEPAARLAAIWPSEADARRAAEARLRSLRRDTLRGEMAMATGDPRLAAMASVSVVDVGAPFDGAWLVDSARHVVDDGGYRTTVNLFQP